jgi:hypothetical protein
MLEQVQGQLLSAIRQRSDAQKTKCISFSLPSNHTYKNSTKWRWRRSTNKSTQTGVLDGSIPLAISDTGATASAFKPLDPSVPMGICSTATFGGAFGKQATATTMNKLHHKLCTPARSIHIVPQVQNSLLSTSKVVNADYIAIYDKEEVNFYDAKTTKVTISEEAVLKGWQCPAAELWRLPLVENPVNLNTITLLLCHPTKLQSQNRLYTVQTTKHSQKHIQGLLSCTNKEEYIHNVYKLPIIERMVRYLHAAAEHPPEDTWVKAVGNGNYNSWPLIDIKNVRKNFPESKETQLGHMQG